MLGSMGIIGMYVSRIFIETKQRPYTIVRHVYERHVAASDPAERRAGTTLIGCASSGRHLAASTGIRPIRRRLRFDRILQIVEEPDGRLTPRLGCGYGALLDTVRERGWPIAYRGIDISADDDRCRHDPARRRPTGGVFNSDSTRRSASHLRGRQRHLQRAGCSTTSRAGEPTCWTTIDVARRAAVSAGSPSTCCRRYSDVERRRDNALLRRADGDVRLTANDASRLGWRCCTTTRSTSSPCS